MISTTTTTTTTTATKATATATAKQFILKRDTIQIPKKEIEDIFNLHHSLSTNELLSLSSIVISKISNWIESVHLAVFTLEQNVKQDNYNIQDMDPLQDALFQMEPFIPLLSDLNDIVLNRQEEQAIVLYNYQLKITKIQSEWSSLQHFSSSVKKLLMSKNEERELIQSVERLLIQMDDISLLIFDFQEKKYINAALLSITSSSPPFITSSCSESTITTTSSTLTPIMPIATTPTADTTTTITRDDQAILEIDNAFEPLLCIIENIYHRIQQQPPDNNKLLKRFNKVKEKWEILQSERDELKYEHKEDKWLSVFKRVADQVDVMIDGLDRSVVQCYTLVQQIKDWGTSSSITSSSQAHSSSFDKFSKSFLKSFHSHHNSSTTTPCPVDKEKFKSIEKSFEAKYKYYTPSIDRMLGMLGNGISARVTRDNTTSQRHEAMMTRWSHLKEVMDDLRSRDLLEAERNISDGASGWKGIRYKTPEPLQQQQQQTRSITPNKSPRIATRSITPNKSPRITTSRAYDQYGNTQQQSLIKGSLSDSSSSTPRSNSRQRPSRNGSTITKKAPTEDFYDQDERYYGVDLMKLNHNNTRVPSTNNYIRSSSTVEIRNRSSSIEKPVTRSKTPNSYLKPPSIRSKSSMGELRGSFIPRPKTPTEIPRHKSLKPPPPVPPLPKYVSRKHQISVTEVDYQPDTKDPLDIEVAKILNASPISIQCSRGTSGKYYFGNEGNKLYTCKLMTYEDRRGGQFKNNKVLIRVGGGWQDLEFFLLEHSSFMTSEVVVRSFTPVNARR